MRRRARPLAPAPPPAPVPKPPVGGDVRVRPMHGYELSDPIAFRRAGPDGQPATVHAHGRGRELWLRFSDGRIGRTNIECLEGWPRAGQEGETA